MKTLRYKLAVWFSRLGKLTRNCPKLSATLSQAGWRIYSKL